jgi:hypothetical protein
MGEFGREKPAEARDANGEILQSGDWVKFKDQRTEDQFTRPAFGFSKEPLKIQRTKMLRTGVLGVGLINNKGESKVLASDYFIKCPTEQISNV